MADQTWPDFYTLPSSPSITCQDRFGLVDSDTPDVPFWSVLSALLLAPSSSSSSSPAAPPATSIPAFIEVLEIIAVELRGASPPDYDTLKASLYARSAEFLSAVWPAIARLALAMPRLFPEHRLPVLKEEEEGVVSAAAASRRRRRRLELSREQAACLVAHQFLGTMAAPPWQCGFQNFDVWYAGEQPHARAPGIYIAAVLNYFARIAGAPSPSLLDYREWTITYELVSRGDGTGRASQAAGHADWGLDVELGDVVLEPFSARTAEAAYLGTDGNAVVIAANRFIGFGRSATQEEVFVGSTPEACPVVLVAPPLGDGQAVVVRGCEAIVRTTGQGRQIELAGVHESPTADAEHYETRWRNRTMLFMDALELDSFDDSQYPDIQHANIERELAKALVGFGSGRYQRIFTGLWGCGAFGGDPGVKMVILWLAASATGSALTITYEAARCEFARKMQELVDLARRRNDKASDVLKLLRSAEGQGLAKGTFLDWILSPG